MKLSPSYWLVLLFAFCMQVSQYLQAASSKEAAPVAKAAEALQCVAFSPYVDNLNPNFGPHPSKALIETLLDKLVAETPFRCIMTYGVMNGLEETFAAAKARKIKVIAIIWLDKDIAINSQSIEQGIAAAKAYPETIIKLSCGSEVRTRHNFAFDGEITRCIDGLRAAGVKQPITTIDTWWEWCNRSRPCHITSFTAKVDWIGINIFPWWENKFSDTFPCTPASKAAEFHVARVQEVKRANPGKDVVITEFGWPNGPNEHTEANTHTGKTCGIASPKNQALVIQQTFNKLHKLKQSGTVFSAFAEHWKQGEEGRFSPYWGLCQGKAPYSCASVLRTLKK